MSTIDFSVAEGTVFVLDRDTQERLLEERRLSGGDRYDEVWEGTYIMSPLATFEHQLIASRLSAIFDEVAVELGIGAAAAGANVTDRFKKWTYNFRCPDVVVLLDANSAKSVGAAVVGGPDLIVEVASPGDRWPQKLPFYSKVGVRELLVVDRDSKHLELYRLQDGELKSVGKSDATESGLLASEVLPLTFQYEAIEQRPSVVVRRTDRVVKEWRV